MPTYIRPARVDITEGSSGIGGLVLIAAAVGAVAAVVAFIAAHIVLLAVCAGAFVAVMGGLAVWFRWLSSPRRLQQHLPAIRASVAAPRAAQPISAAPRAMRRQLSEPWPVVSLEKVPASPRVIEPTRVIPPAPGNRPGAHRHQLHARKARKDQCGGAGERNVCPAPK
jgi:hypothetical protein